MIKAEEWNKGRLIAEQMRVSELKAESLTWRNQPQTSITASSNTDAIYTSVTDIIDRIDATIDDRVVTYSDTIKYKPLICKCCGAPINRETMTCEYCGTQYGKG